MMTYKRDGISYDIGLLDEEAQGLFGLLQQAMIKVRGSSDEVQLFQAGAQHIKSLLEDKLTDEAIVAETEDTEVAIEV